MRKVRLQPEEKNLRLMRLRQIEKNQQSEEVSYPPCSIKFFPRFFCLFDDILHNKQGNFIVMRNPSRQDSPIRSGFLEGDVLSGSYLLKPV